jgi:hypothetical protein
MPGASGERRNLGDGEPEFVRRIQPSKSVLAVRQAEHSLVGRFGREASLKLKRQARKVKPDRLNRLP